VIPDGLIIQVAFQAADVDNGRKAVSGSESRCQSVDRP